MDELMSAKFVYGKLTSIEKEVIMSMWTQAGVLSAKEAKRRVSEVSVLMIQKNILMGVSTVYVSSINDMGDYFWLRMFILPQFRGNLPLRKLVMQENFYNLKNHFSPKIKGIALELENQKLAHLASETRYMHARGYSYAGKSTRGLPLWYVDFDNPKGIFVLKEEK